MAWIQKETLDLILPTTRGGFSFYPEHNKGFTILGNFLGSKYGHPNLGWDYTFYIGNGENRDSVNAAQFDENVIKPLVDVFNLFTKKRLNLESRFILEIAH